MLFGMQHNKRTNKMENLTEKFQSEINHLKKQEEELYEKWKQIDSNKKSLIDDVLQGNEKSINYYNKQISIMKHIDTQIQSNKRLLYLISCYEH